MTFNAPPLTLRQRFRFYTSWHYIRQTRPLLPLAMWWLDRR